MNHTSMAELALRDTIRRIDIPSLPRSRPDRSKIWWYVLAIEIPGGLLLARYRLRFGLFSESFTPHGYCLSWDPLLLSLHVVASLIIAAAYFSIPLAATYFIRKRQGDVMFRELFLLCGAFILLCGAGHLMGVVTLWYPIYWPKAIIKALTAIVSVATAMEIWRVMPQALALPRQIKPDLV